ncbi:unnamed protein product [Paramecium sonneborni]|uniref:Uncharacterized protein n=1 Tax=Paramecium sonneborni TaxID=65129 RepID=A0A8S1RT74_9CILI|nr:unnamed protein product [Paramecium sonneborni]
MAVLSVHAYFLFQHFKGQKQNLNISKQKNEQHEGVCLLKKLLFIFILISLQEYDIFQCTMITLLNFGYIGYLLSIKQYMPKIEFFGLIWTEAPVMLVTFTSLVYCRDFSGYLTSDQQTDLGFGQIGIFILGLLGPLIQLGFKLSRDLQQCYQKNKQKPELL